MRTAFKRHLAVSPREYRQRFSRMPRQETTIAHAVSG
jgi:AraC-like DNA-binding protein